MAVAPMRAIVVRWEADSHGQYLPSLDTRTRELICKVVFAGPMGAGVGTTFRELWALIPDAASTAVIPGPGDPPVYQLRFRPRPTIHVQGMKLAFNLWGYEAEPTGQGFVRTLDGVDALVFVADSDPVAARRNQIAMREVNEGLVAAGARPSKTAMLLQYNKRDLKDALAIPELEAQLNPMAWPFVATAASRSQGLQELLDRISSVVPDHLLGNSTDERRLSPTDSMTSAFVRAERKLFKRDIDAALAPQTVATDEDRTVLGSTGASPFAAKPFPSHIPSSPMRPHAAREETSTEGPAVKGLAVTGAETTLRTPEVIDVDVPDLSGYTVNRLGTPELLNPRWVVVPFFATAPSNRKGADADAQEPVEIELRIRLGRSSPVKEARAVPRPAPPPMPSPGNHGAAAADEGNADGQAPAEHDVRTARKAPPTPTVPWSWFLFAGVLLLVVVVAYLLGSTLS